MANKSHFFGQGSTEYLVIIGVVLVIALLVVSLLGFFPSTAGEANVGQSQLYWRGQAKPFTVIDALFSGTDVCLAGSGSGVVLVMKNNEKYTLTLNEVRFKDVPYSICPRGNATGNVSFAPGQEILVGVDQAPGAICVNRKGESLKTALSYDSPYIAGKLQQGSTNLYVSCQ